MYAAVKKYRYVHFPTNPLLLRPIETQMDSAKGFLKYWVTMVKSGRIFYEMGDLLK